MRNEIDAFQDMLSLNNEELAEAAGISLSELLSLKQDSLLNADEKHLKAIALVCKTSYEDFIRFCGGDIGKIRTAMPFESTLEPFIDGFMGHVQLYLSCEKRVIEFPVTSSTWDDIVHQLKDEEINWLSFETLNCRKILVRKLALQAISCRYFEEDDLNNPHYIPEVQSGLKYYATYNYAYDDVWPKHINANYRNHVKNLANDLQMNEKELFCYTTQCQAYLRGRDTERDYSSLTFKLDGDGVHDLLERVEKDDLTEYLQFDGVGNQSSCLLRSYEIACFDLARYNFDQDRSSDIKLNASWKTLLQSDRGTENLKDTGLDFDF